MLMNFHSANYHVQTIFWKKYFQLSAPQTPPKNYVNQFQQTSQLLANNVLEETEPWELCIFSGRLEN